MICYKDKTFCSFYKDCKDGAGCRDALTDKVIADAERWAGNTGLSIARYASEPECFTEKQSK